jgi:CPA2 family monovalent cation:H+ antiporter-2
VSVIGVDEQINSFREALAPNVPAAELHDVAQEYSLKQFRVVDGSPYLGKTIRDCGIREKSHGLVVGLERGEKRLLNPDSTTVIEAMDILWIVGESALLKRL